MSITHLVYVSASFVPLTVIVLLQLQIKSNQINEMYLLYACITVCVPHIIQLNENNYYSQSSEQSLYYLYAVA